MGMKFVAFQRRLDGKPEEDLRPSWARALGPEWKWSFDEPFGGAPEDARGRRVSIFLRDSYGRDSCDGYWFAHSTSAELLSWREEGTTTIIGYRVVD